MYYTCSIGKEKGIYIPAGRGKGKGMTGRKPDRKPFGREGPPKGYPKDQTQYADPENWRYPLHTPWHARAARRYFDEWPNRSKYSEEERAYIDWRIDEALKRFGTEPGTDAKGQRSTPITPSRKKPEELSLKELLRLFLGPARLKRASEIDDSLVSILEIGPNSIDGKVKNYTVRIDAKHCTILHDCQDWRNNLESKSMCKHLGKFLTKLDPKTATQLLQGILKDKEKWKFVAPETTGVAK
jgi:hypothetical protein